MNIVFCCENCRYQKDGYCTFEDISVYNFSLNEKCAYFIKK